MSLRIWFNRTYATNAHIIDLLRANPQGRPIHVLASHVDPHSPVLGAADEAHAEPSPALTGRDYVDWALDFARRHRVEVFLPRLEIAAIAAARDEFIAAGTAVVAPPAAAIRLFDDKAAAYADAAGRGLPVPDHRVVTDASGLAAAYADLREVSDLVCLKPVSGVGGEGFRILSEAPLSLGELLGPITATESLTRACEALEHAARDGQPIPPLLVLPYLPGPEVSVDCLADSSGQLLAAVGRSKRGRQRIITDDAGALAVARTLVSAHRIESLCNVQVRYWASRTDPQPRPYLLEVNTRLSGGLFQTALSGLNLAWAGVQQAIGEPVALGPARFDIAYTTVTAISRPAASQDAQA